MWFLGDLFYLIVGYMKMIYWFTQIITVLFSFLEILYEERKVKFGLNSNKNRRRWLFWNQKKTLGSIDSMWDVKLVWIYEIYWIDNRGDRQTISYYHY